jgi:hypothetical protein
VALFEVVAGNSDAKTYSTATATKQGRAQPRKCFAIADGRTAVGVVIAHGARWLARDAKGRDVGIYDTVEQAIAALPAPKVQP